jgi:hypothetical protein
VRVGSARALRPSRFCGSQISFDVPKPQDPRVPDEVEEYLVGRIARAGQVGGAAGGAIGGGGAGLLGGRRGGARGGERGARRIQTLVEERKGHLELTQEQVRARVLSVAPKAQEMPAKDRLRWAVPVGVTGLTQVVVDVATTADDGDGQVVLRAFGKEGMISRHPTKQLADELWTALAH